MKLAIASFYFRKYAYIFRVDIVKLQLTNRKNNAIPKASLGEQQRADNLFLSVTPLTFLVRKCRSIIVIIFRNMREITHLTIITHDSEQSRPFNTFYLAFINLIAVLG